MIYDKICVDKIDKFRYLDKNYTRFCICFQETGFGFNILFVYSLTVSGSGF